MGNLRMERPIRIKRLWIFSCYSRKNFVPTGLLGQTLIFEAAQPACRINFSLKPKNIAETFTFIVKLTVLMTMSGAGCGTYYLAVAVLLLYSACYLMRLLH